MMHMRPLIRLSAHLWNRTKASVAPSTIASRMNNVSINAKNGIQVRTFMQRKGFRPRSDRWKLFFFGSSMGLAVSVYANYYDIMLLPQVNKNEFETEPIEVHKWPNPAKKIKLHPAPEKDEKNEKNEKQ